MLEQITILGVHYHLSENTSNFIKEKLEKLSYLNEMIVDGTLRIIHEKNEYKAEIDIHFNHGKILHLEVVHEQLYPAIENLMHKIKKMAAEEKEKVKDYHNHHVNHRHVENDK